MAEKHPTLREIKRKSLYESYRHASTTRGAWTEADYKGELDRRSQRDLTIVIAVATVVYAIVAVIQLWLLR
jgi:hypothetical protein